MPIYEYRCRECHHAFEAIQKFSDDPLTRCPACSAEAALEKLVSAPAFRLGGSGWYETDFKKDGKKNLASKESASKDSGAAAGSGRSGSTAKSTDSKANSSQPAAAGKTGSSASTTG